MERAKCSRRKIRLASAMDQYVRLSIGASRGLTMVGFPFFFVIGLEVMNPGPGERGACVFLCFAGVAPVCPCATGNS